MTLPPCVLLDRDGVLNRDRPDYVATPAQWFWEDGVLEALAELREAGIPVAVVTNQAGVGAGRMQREALEAVHERMRVEAEEAGARIDAVFFCPHTDAEGCSCRKPAPGLLVQAARHFGCPLAGVPFVGDARRDLDAAVAAGARPVLVRTGRGRATEAAGAPEGTEVYGDLRAFVRALLGAEGPW